MRIPFLRFSILMMLISAVFSISSPQMARAFGLSDFGDFLPKRCLLPDQEDQLIGAVRNEIAILKLNGDPQGYLRVDRGDRDEVLARYLKLKAEFQNVSASTLQKAIHQVIDMPYCLPWHAQHVDPDVGRHEYDGE